MEGMIICVTSDEGGEVVTGVTDLEVVVTFTAAVQAVVDSNVQP